MKSAEEYKAIFYRQLALDYCCRPEEILSGRNQFHVYRPLEGRRQFWTGEDCLLKAASVRGSIGWETTPSGLRSLAPGVIVCSCRAARCFAAMFRCL